MTVTHAPEARPGRTRTWSWKYRALLVGACVAGLAAWPACGDGSIVPVANGGDLVDGSSTTPDGGTAHPEGGVVTPDTGATQPDSATSPSQQDSGLPPPPQDGGTPPPQEDGGTGPDAGSGVVPNAAKICPAVSPGAHEQYHLPAVTSLPSGVTSLTDWGQFPDTGGFNGKQAMDACRLPADGFLTSHGKPAARVEVQPGDDPLALGSDSERSEMYALQTAAGAVINDSSSSGVQYYATSCYFPTSWGGTQIHGNSNSWSIVAQFHPGGSGTWGFLYAAKRDVDGPQHYWVLFGGTEIQFSDGGAITFDQWTDFVIAIDWGGSTLSIWRRDEGQTSFTQVIASHSVGAPSGGCYFKQGLYRGGDVSGRTDVLWFGPTARGDSFSAVEQAVFGTNVGP